MAGKLLYNQLLQQSVLCAYMTTFKVFAIACFILIPFMSYKGASLSTVIAEFSVMIMNGYSCWDIIRPIVFNKEILKNFIESIFGCIAIVIVCFSCSFAEYGVILKTIFPVVLSIIIYVAILVFLNNKVAVTMLQQIRIRLRDKL